MIYNILTLDNDISINWHHKVKYTNVDKRVKGKCM